MKKMEKIEIFEEEEILMKSQELMKKINIEKMIKKKVEGMLGMVKIGKKIGYKKILQMYEVMMIMKKIMILMERIRMKIMMGVQGVVWLM